MRNLRWGIIGCGDVCEVKSGPALQKAMGSELVAVCRRDGEKAADFAMRHGVPRWATDPQAIIDDPEVDIVYIATPPGSHHEYALRVAAAGKPCYVEKPMARTAAECHAMNDAFEKAKQKLFVAYYRRRLPRFVEARRLLDAGEIGAITSVSLMHTSGQMLRVDPAAPPWRINAEHSGGGLFLDLGSHALDVLDELLGPIESVTGRAGRAFHPPGQPAPTTAGDVEDTVAMSFTIAGGAAGVAHWNFASETPTDRLDIFGTRGSIHLAVFAHPDLTVTRDGQTHTRAYPDPPHVHQPLVQTVVDELSGGDTRCPSTGRSATRFAVIADAVLDRYYAGRGDEFWARPKTWNRP